MTINAAMQHRAYALAAVPFDPLTISAFQEVIQEVLLSQAINRDTLRSNQIPICSYHIGADPTRSVTGL